MERRGGSENIRKVEPKGISSLITCPHRPGSGQDSGDMDTQCHSLQFWGGVKGDSQVSVRGSGPMAVLLPVLTAAL